LKRPLVWGERAGGGTEGWFVQISRAHRIRMDAHKYNIFQVKILVRICIK
jgi:hypothetical protein